MFGICKLSQEIVCFHLPMELWLIQLNYKWKNGNVFEQMSTQNISIQHSAKIDTEQLPILIIDKPCQNPYGVCYINIQCIFVQILHLQYLHKHHVIVLILFTYAEKCYAHWLFWTNFVHNLSLSLFVWRVYASACIHIHICNVTQWMCRKKNGARLAKKHAHTKKYICQAHFHPLREFRGWKMCKSFSINHTFRMLFHVQNMFNSTRITYYITKQISSKVAKRKSGWKAREKEWVRQRGRIKKQNRDNRKNMCTIFGFQNLCMFSLNFC